MRGNCIRSMKQQVIKLREVMGEEYETAGNQREVNGEEYETAGNQVERGE